MEDYNLIREDFDLFADTAEPLWNHSSAYYPLILRLAKGRPDTALEIGCGRGALSRLLAEKCGSVLGVDLSPKMTERARELSSGVSNLDFVCENILEHMFLPESLDIIVTVATSHHLPYEWLLETAKTALRPGGKLIVIDLYKPETAADSLFCAAAVIPNIFMNLIKNGGLQKDDAHTRELWRRHGARDTYLPLSKIREMSRRILPEAKVKRRLFWRYLLLWKKPNN